MKILALLDLIPTWLLVALIALLSAGLGAEAIRVAHAREDAAKARQQLAQVEADLTAYKLSVSEATRLLQASNDRRAFEQLTKVKEAQDAAKIREAVLVADADGARKQLDRLRIALRKAIATRGDPVPGAAPDATAEPAATVGKLFLECAAAYGELAKKAGGHASDVQTLTEGWPRNGGALGPR